MNAFSPFCRGVIGIQLLFLGAAVSCAQTFVFDFKSNDQQGVFRDLGGTNAISDWDSASNFLDDLDGTQNKSGFLYFDFDGGAGLDLLELDSSSYLNWTSDGFGDGGSGFNTPGEFISFTFNRDGRIDVLDLVAFNGNESLSIQRIGAADVDFIGDDAAHGSVLSPNVTFSAGQRVTLLNNDGRFFLESMTVSAVPEPGTIVCSVLGASIALLLARRRPRSSGRT